MASSSPPNLTALPGGWADADDQELLQEGFHAGDRRAFEALARPHLDGLFTLCLRLTRNRAEAEDVAQDALVKAMQRCDRYDPKRPFRPWLYKVAVNLCRDRVRTVWWKRVAGLGERPMECSRPSPATLTHAHQRDVLVRDALSRLPDIYREALALYHLQDLRYREIAAITGVSVPALKQRVRRGSQMLRKEMASLYPELLPARRSDERE